MVGKSIIASALPGNSKSTDKPENGGAGSCAINVDSRDNPEVGHCLAQIR